MKRSGKTAAETIRVGIVGAGANTRLRHLPGLKAIPGVEIVSVANRTRESAARVAAEFGIPKVYDHWTELVDADDTDAIVIGTWPVMHCQVMLEAFECNKHVLCEARMAMNAGEAHGMLEGARRRPHLVAQLVPAPMTLTADGTIQKLIADGFLGDVLAVEVRALQKNFMDRESPLHWRQDAELSGFNTLSLGIWYEALMRWVGPATRVTALAKVFVHRRKGADGLMRAVTVPDHVDALALMACGAAAHLRFSAVTGLPPPDEAWLFGSEGTLQFDAASRKLFGGRRGDAALKEIELPAVQGDGWRVEEEFVRAIRREQPVTRTTFEDGVRYMEFTEAALRSAQSGQSIGLPL
jgi:predicted dehydrogenase